VLTTFWVLFVLVSFTDLLDDMQQNKVKGVVLLHYFAFKSGDILHLMTPVAVLVSVLITFGIMARRQEITAMKAAGISVYRAVLPALGLGLVISVGMFAASEYLIPSLNRVAAEDFNRIKGRPPQSTTNLQNRWMLGSDGKFYNYDYLERGGADRVTFYGMSVFDVNEAKWELNNRLYATRAVWNGVSYSLERGWRRSFKPLRFASLPDGTRTREIDPPNYFNQENRESETLSFVELRGHIRALEGLGLDVTRLRVELHRKVAFPMVSLVMTLLGIPFAFVVSRRGALYGVAASMVLAIVYWAFIAIFEALGNYAVLPPALAAWAPNLLFGATGLFFTLTLET
jgi:LPS export ABC transporter permease LptG